MVTRPYTFDHSGWWLRRSASRATLHMKPQASTKFSNRNVRSIACPLPHSVQSRSEARASAHSSSLSRAPAICSPCGRLACRPGGCALTVAAMDPALLTATDLACLRGERLLFRGLSFALGPGEAVQIAGPNGTGKSSLLRILAGLLQPFSGTVTGNGDASLLDERLPLDE